MNYGLVQYYLDSATIVRFEQILVVDYLFEKSAWYI